MKGNHFRSLSSEEVKSAFRFAIDSTVFEKNALKLAKIFAILFILLLIINGSKRNEELMKFEFRRNGVSSVHTCLLMIK